MHCFFLHSTQCFIKLEVGIHSNPTPNCLVSQVPESMGVFFDIGQFFHNVSEFLKFFAKYLLKQNTFISHTYTEIEEVKSR